MWSGTGSLYCASISSINVLKEKGGKVIDTLSTKPTHIKRLHIHIPIHIHIAFTKRAKIDRKTGFRFVHCSVT